MYRQEWKRTPNTHVRVGMKTNGSTVVKITHPNITEEGAYVKQWDGHTILKKNPRYMNITLASGKTIPSTEIMRELEDVV
jgi:archaellum component FlaF (FlaF/FlaG flagellin family)